MQNTTSKALHTLKIRSVRGAKVSRAADYMVKQLSVLDIGLEVVRSQREFLGFFIILAVSDWGIEPHPRPYPCLNHATLDVVA
jgi:hypothetical protein